MKIINPIILNSLTTRTSKYYTANVNVLNNYLTVNGKSIFTNKPLKPISAKMI